MRDYLLEKSCFRWGKLAASYTDDKELSGSTKCRDIIYYMRVY
jgi:hypothetical protein